MELGRNIKSENYERVCRALDGLRPIAEKNNITLGQLALAWVLSRPKTCAIVGARNAEQITQSAKAAEVRLSEADFQEIDAIGRTVTDPMDDNPVLWDF